MSDPITVLLVDDHELIRHGLRRAFENDPDFEVVAEAGTVSGALEAVADQAILRGTGARGLRAILEEVLLDVQYDLPSRDDIRRCVITADVVSSGVNPTLVPRDREAPERTRRERSA